ncbi:MAG: GntR family transcriptional regulator [Anaerovoracaceae bacterium]
MQKFNNESPIYIQIIEEIKKEILRGELEPNQRIASVRELGIKYGVNPNTMQRALSELEREGILRTERTNGRFVTDDKALIKNIRRNMADEIYSRFNSDMKKIGYTQADIEKLIK